MNDDDAAAGHLHLRQNVRGKQDRVLFAQIFDQFAHLPDLIWIETDRRLVENEKIRFVQQRVRQANPLTITFGERADQLLLDFLKSAKFFYISDSFRNAPARDRFERRAIN